ncbi:MAG: NUDIX hydrolase [Acutalibacteraceae bacterium]
MQGYNAIVVFCQNADKMLMCKRRRNPYKGLSNFVGGKIEENENGLDAAYRELEEETTISRNDIILSHLMDFTYHLGNCYLEVYVGKLNRAINVSGDENELYWTTLDNDFFDVTKYAGEGNIGHIMMHVKMYQEELLK